MAFLLVKKFVIATRKKQSANCCKDVVMPTNIFIILIKLAQAGLTRTYINFDI